MSKKNKGLGDSIENVLKATGIDKVAKKVLGDDCGCEERKKRLNQMFPNWKNIRQFTQDEIKIYEEVIPIVDKRGNITREEKIIISTLYRSAFSQEPQWSSCSSCNQKVLKNLSRVYEESCKI
jgi:hypothetical protein